MPTTGSVWGFACSACLAPEYKSSYGYSFRYDYKDTIFSNGTSYTKWISLNKKDGNHFTRSEKNKVYVYEDGKETLLYDFNLTVNDTFKCRYPLYLFKDTFLLLVVKSDGLITMQNGQKRRQLILQDTTSNKESHQMTWVEGIGEMESGFFYIPSKYILADPPNVFVCFCDNSGTIYQKNTSITCENVDSIGVSAPITEKIDIKCFVSNKELSVFSNSDFCISLFDITGRLLLTTKQTKVSLTGISTGVYFVYITLQSGEIITKQFVLE